MSLIKANAVQIGQSPTATQNFTLAVPSSPDGTIKLARGNSGATTQDVLSVDASGNINGLVKTTGSTTARSLANRFADVVNVLDFGADPTGVVDSTTAFLNATAGSKTIIIPDGTYKIPNAKNIGYSGGNRTWICGNVTINDTVSTPYKVSNVFIGSVLPSNRGPIAIANSGMPSTASGENVGLQISDARFHGGSPGVNGKCMQSIFASNVDITSPTSQGVWGLNILVANDDLFPNPSNLRCVEFEILAENLLQTDPWGPGSVASQPPRSNAVEIIGHGSSTSNPTSCIMTWANDSTGSKWWQYGAAFSRITKYGLYFKKDPQKIYNPSAASDTGLFLGGSVSNGAVIRDESDSTNIISASGSHTNIVNLADCTNIGTFALGKSSSNTDFIFKNNADYRTRIYLDSGNTTAQSADITFSDRISQKWSLIKNALNTLSIYSHAAGKSSLLFDTDATTLSDSNIIPLVNNSYTLGTTTGGNKVWSNIYSQNPVTVVSDEREKKEIMPSILGLDFIKSLNPVSYKFKVGQRIATKYDENSNPIEFEEIAGTRNHFGLIAQEVKAALPDGVDFGGWILTDKNNPDSEQGLRYEEFIAPLIKAVQELSQENALLKQRIEALESK
jgi:hypothetical protein